MEKTEKSLYVALAYKMIDVDRTMRGCAIYMTTSDDPKEKQYGTFGAYSLPIGKNKDGKIVYAMRSHHREEIAMVGFNNYYNNPNDITENDIREEHLLPRRVGYN